MYVNTGCVLQHGAIQGKVLDCKTRQPISGAKIVARESDWGWSSNGLVWDKDYFYAATSDAQGQFALHYRHDESAHLTIRKDGYRFTLMDTPSQNKLEIGMLAGPETDWSRSCRPREECLKVWMEKGVEMATDICTQ